MKISRHFRLGKTQYELDFVDIDLDNDTPLFIDPYFLSIRRDRWSMGATGSIRNFFQKFIQHLKAGRQDEALEIFSELSEPNETRLGLSQGRSQGRGVGDGDSKKIFDSLLASRAVQTGVVEDIEDCRVFVDGIDKDKVSDMTTNIIREHLIVYTQRQCRLCGIPLTAGVSSGSIWNRQHRRWEAEHTDMLVVGGRKLLLVPKGIVGFSLKYTGQEYHQHFVLNFLQSENLRLNTALVKVTNPAKGPKVRYVTKKSLIETGHSFDKDYLTSFTAQHPEVFAKFKDLTKRKVHSLANEDLTESHLGDVVDHLIAKLAAIPPGRDNATEYHRLIAGILELVFYPKLTNPQLEREVNDGRKRIDIVFDNAADRGFFFRLTRTYQTPCQFILIECKNYSDDLRNPELDQMIGRFDLNRGKFGIIVCRTLDDKALFMRRCTDTLRAGQGVIVPLIDEDIVAILQSLKNGQRDPEEAVLMRKFREIGLA
jgi:hypothetical protein